MPANVFAIHGQALAGVAFGVIIVRRVLAVFEVICALALMVFERPVGRVSGNWFGASDAAIFVKVD